MHVSLLTIILFFYKETKAECICVPPQMCNDPKKISNGVGYLDIRYNNDGTTQECTNYFEICCDNPQTNDLNTLENAVDPNTSTSSSVATAPKGCGYEQSVEMAYRITGAGANTQFGESPWSIVLLLQTGQKNMYKCGGSLISYQVVLTAAHCVVGQLDGEWTIRAGEWNTRSQDEMLPHQDQRVKEILIHPQYQSGSLKNDIALLFLVDGVRPAENVNFICLPPPGYKHVRDNERCVASGWGKDAFKKGKHSSVLKKVELPIVARDECVQALRATRLGKFYHLDKSFICAGGEANKDTCKGDGGSPLVCPIKDDKHKAGRRQTRWIQMGIVSWGIGCGESKTPGVYANVALYRDWVDKELAARGLDTSLYKYE